MRLTRVSASAKTTFAFSLVWRNNACVSHACLHQLKRQLHFPWYGVKVHVFHTRLYIGKDGICVFFGFASQCMRFKCVSTSVKTAFAFSLVWYHNTCVSHACLHLLRRLTRFSCYGVTMHAFHTLKTTFAFFFVSRMHAFHTCVCIC